MNHLIIGLGGTGGRIIRELRKLVRQEYPDGRGEPRRRLADGTLGPLEARVGFLYVESNKVDFDNTRGWDVFGESVQLEESQRVFINEGDLGAAVANINQNSAIAPWIGRKDRLREILRNTRLTEGANQIRRRGRFLLAKSVYRFRDQVRDEVNRLQVGANDGRVTFHVCLTLAGGTGSGSVVDVITQLRSAYPVQMHPIHVYALITDHDVGRAATGNFYANQYAGLLELNALWLKDYSPHDIARQGQRMTDVQNCFQSACLLTAFNRNAQKLELDEQESVIAEYLFKRAVVQDAAAGDFAKTWSYEDVNQYPGEGGRCYRFGSLGVKRWAIPETEIREKLGHTFALSAVWQMLYNHWLPDEGYQPDEGKFDPTQEVAQSSEATLWRLAESQVLLDHRFELQQGASPIPSWRDDWKAIIRGACNHARQNMPNQPGAWLREVRQRAEEHYRRGFRQRGVEIYFQEKLAPGDQIGSVKDYARAVRDALQADLLGRWRSGILGFHDVKRSLAALRAEVDRRARLVDREQEDLSGPIATSEAALLRHERLWNKNPLVKRLFPSVRDRHFTIFEQQICRHFTDRTHKQALTFKCRLLQEVRNLIVELEGHLGIILQKLKQAADESNKVVVLRVPDGKERQFEDSLVREYDTASIEALRRALWVRETAQFANAEAARAAVQREISPGPTFAKLKDWLSREDGLRRVLERVSYEAAQTHHEVLVSEGNHAPVLGVGIIAKLRERYQGRFDSLRADVLNFMRKAAPAYMLDANQDQPRIIESRNEMPTMPIRRMAVFLPVDLKTADEFERELIERFRRSVAEVTVDIISTERKNEISVVAADYWMAARFFTTVQRLKERYLARIASTRESNSEDAIMEIHIEDFERPLTDLFLPSSIENARTAHSLALLGRLTGNIRDGVVGGVQAVTWVKTDPAGLPLHATPERLAESDAGLDSLTVQELAALKQRVSEMLRQRYAASPSFSTELEGKIMAHLDEVLAVNGGDRDDAAYLDTVAYAEEARKLVNQTLA